MGRDNLRLLLEAYVDGRNVDPESLDSQDSGFEINRYRSWDDYVGAITPVIESLGEFPTAEYLRKNGLGQLVDATYRFHDNFGSVRRKMGHGDHGNVAKYDTKELLLEELSIVWEDHPEKNGKIPSDNWLRENGYAYLGHAIVKHHGGFRKVRSELGMSALRMADAVDLSEWDTFSSTISQLYEDHPEFGGKLPSSNWLTSNNYNAVAVAIRENHGGARKVRAKLGETDIRKPNGYWNDWKNLERELREVMESHPELNGKVPSCQWLRSNGLGYIAPAMTNLHGGVNAVRRKFGESDILGDYWGNWSNVREELELVMDQYGRLPGTWTLRKNGFGKLANAINTHHGGMKAVRVKMEDYVPSADDRE